MDMRLELVPPPTTDVERSKAFYVDRVGFNLDHDIVPGNGMRDRAVDSPRIVVLDRGGGGDQRPPCRTGTRTSFGSGRPRIHTRPPAGQERRCLGDERNGRRQVRAFSGDPDGNSWALQEIPG